VCHGFWEKPFTEPEQSLAPNLFRLGCVNFLAFVIHQQWQRRSLARAFARLEGSHEMT
jgi:hypothetical protein